MGSLWLFHNLISRPLPSMTAPCWMLFVMCAACGARSGLNLDPPDDVAGTLPVLVPQPPADAEAEAAATEMRDGEPLHASFEAAADATTLDVVTPSMEDSAGIDSGPEAAC